jgi:FKBP-type peptidyl-prolyl cis-trans isomerase
MYKYLLFSAVGLMIGCDKTEEGIRPKELKSFEDSLSYSIGGSFAKGVIDNHQKLDEELSIKLNLDAVREGFLSGLDSSQINLLTEQDNKDVQQSFQELVRNKEELKIQETLEKGNAFLESNKLQEGVQVTKSGLQYKVLKEGVGDRPLPSSNVKIHYTGKFIDGKVFDSSIGREPSVNSVGGFVPGFSEGLLLMSTGSKYELVIPYQIAYGPRGMKGAIPAYSNLIFEVELLEIVK